MMDRGFELMIPKSKEEDKTDFKYDIRFSIFGREFVLQLKVNRKE